MPGMNSNAGAGRHTWVPPQALGVQLEAHQSAPGKYNQIFKLKLLHTGGTFWAHAAAVWRACRRTSARRRLPKPHTREVLAPRLLLLLLPTRSMHPDPHVQQAPATTTKRTSNSGS